MSKDAPARLGFWPEECRVGDMAALLGIQDRQIQVLVQRGVLPAPVRGRYKTLPVVHAYLHFLRDRIRRREAEDSEDGGTDKDRLAKAKADIAEMEAGRLRGDLLPSVEVRRADELLFANLRDRVMAIGQHAPVVLEAALKDGEQAVRRELRALARAALAELAAAEVTAADDTED